MGDPVVHFSVLGKDAGALAEFYAGAFGWERAKHPDPASSFLLPGTPDGVTGVVKPEDRGDPRSRITLWIEVDDIDATLVRVECLGGTTTSAPAELDRGPRVAQFADPEGNIMGVTERGRETLRRYRATESGPET